ncbi:hypothetical protein SANTM175S_00543 [Streptomyces antimycoticus]
MDRPRPPCSTWRGPWGSPTPASTGTSRPRRRCAKPSPWRWLGRAREDIAAVAADTRQVPPERLRTWLTTLFAAKRKLLSEDPELFATYRVLAAEHSDAAADHVTDLLEQLRVIIADGVTAGDFTCADPAATARTVFDATMAYHHPAHAPEWQAPGTEAALEAVCALLVNGLRFR